MLLADTSVWVHHLCHGEPILAALLNEGKVVCHPFIIGELAIGNLRNRKEILSLMQSLPTAICATHEEVLEFIERNRLMGRGVGYVDAHLLASARLSQVPIWTFDKRLQETSCRLGIAFTV